MRVTIPAPFPLVFAATLLLLGGPGCDARPETLGGPVAVVQGKPPTHGMLGIEFAQPPADPLEVVAVLPGSPAEESGLAAGDRITAIDGQAVASFAELQGLLKRTNPGATVRVGVTRGDQASSVNVRLMSFGEFVSLRHRTDGGRHAPQPTAEVDNSD